MPGVTKVLVKRCVVPYTSVSLLSCKPPQVWLGRKLRKGVCVDSRPSSIGLCGIPRFFLGRGCELGRVKGTLYPEVPVHSPKCGFTPYPEGPGT